MGIRDDGRRVGNDLLADAWDLLRGWGPSVLRFILFFAVLRYVVGMDHERALEVGALIAFADVATHPRAPKAKRLSQDIRTIVRRDGSIERDVHTEEDEG